MNTEKLQILIKKSANGDEEAFEQLLSFIVPIIYKDLSRYLDNKHDIDDVIQDTIWKIWSSIDRVDSQSEPVAFFRKIAYNTLMSFYRKKKKQEIYISPDDFLNIETPGENSDDDSLSQLSEKLSSLLDKLPDRYKRAVVLRYIEEKDYEEIATIMNVTPQTARQLVSRGIRKLKKLAGDENV